MTGADKPRVLLTDDEPLVARLYSRAVEAAGYESHFAPDGETAFEKIVEAAPDLLVTDLNMPGLGGDALAERILQRGLKTFPIILMTADDTASLLESGVRSGVDDFMVKGMPFDRFRARLAHWIEGPHKGLPAHIRADARESIGRRPPPSPPIERLHGDLDWLSARAGVVVRDLLSREGADYGTRPVEALRLLGVIDGTLALLARSNGLAQLRRLETTTAVVAGLDSARQTQLQPLLARFEQVARDATFRHAAQSLKLRL
ncbi:MAG: response regulator [Pacificimonas sp.]